MFRAKVIYLNVQRKLFLKTGESQDNVLSFFLFNVFMHRFDKFCLKLKILNVSSLSTKANFSMPRRIKKIEKLNYQTFKFGAKPNVFCETNQKVYIKKSFLKLHYVRYADELFFGFDMPKNKALSIVKTLHIFIKSDLQLTVGGFYIRHACSDNTPFLGFFFRRSSDLVSVKNRTIEKFQRIKARILRRQALEYQKYLKLVEDLGRKAIRDCAVLSLKSSLHRPSKIVSNYLFFKNLERAP